MVNHPYPGSSHPRLTLLNPSIAQLLNQLLSSLVPPVAALHLHVARHVARHLGTCIRVYYDYVGYIRFLYNIYIYYR